MGIINVGGRTFDDGNILSFLHNMMKNYPDLTAREILWSYFLPNDRAIEDAQEKGSPVTLSMVMARVSKTNSVNGLDRLSKIEKQDIPGIYLLNIIKTDNNINEDVNCLLITAKSSSHARSVASQRANIYKNPPNYKSVVSIWKNTILSTCRLVAHIDMSSTSYRCGVVLFAGSSKPQ